MSNTVHVKNIASSTTEKEVRDFFSFCGKISSLSVTSGTASTDSSTTTGFPTTASEAGETQSATVTFEKETAAKTALLLDNTQLGPSQVQVTSAASSGQSAGAKSAGHDEHNEEVSQEDKPRARIIAEYLAHGYVISDKAIERALDVDKQHGISNRFTKALTDFDAKYKASEKAQAVDQKYQVSQKATASWSGLSSYFEKALETPTGQRVRSFYAQGNRQVMDVHNEARHLANLKSGKSDMTTVPGTDKTKCNCGADTGKCPCAPGKCACSSCAKNPEVSTTKVDAETADMTQVPGTNKTKCNCGGDSGKCPCEPGKCACASCPKN